MMMIHPPRTTVLLGALFIVIGPQIVLAFMPGSSTTVSQRSAARLVAREDVSGVLHQSPRNLLNNNNEDDDIEERKNNRLTPLLFEEKNYGMQQSSSTTVVDRRGLLLSIGCAGMVMSNTILLSSRPLAAHAATEGTKKTVVVVAGATGQTGRRVLERLVADQQNSWQVIAGVRSVENAVKALSESSTVIRGAMVQKVAAVTSSVSTTAADAPAAFDLRRLDVVKDSVNDLAAALQGVDKLVIAVGFVPGNPLKMNQAAHEVDNIGTCKLIDAAKQAQVQKIVMVSSILTNGRAWGQEKSPGFVITNAFGNVLDEKIVAENYLRASGINYTIVRPGGLKAKPPSGALFISGEDTLLAGEISRDLVADVCVASLTDSKVSNKVIEIIEDEGKPAQVFNGLSM